MCASLVVFLFFGPAAVVCLALAARLANRDEASVRDVPRTTDRYVHLDEGNGRSSVWYLPPDGSRPVCVSRVEDVRR